MEEQTMLNAEEEESEEELCGSMQQTVICPQSPPAAASQEAILRPEIINVYTRRSKKAGKESEEGEGEGMEHVFRPQSPAAAASDNNVVDREADQVIHLRDTPRRAKNNIMCTRKRKPPQPTQHIVEAEADHGQSSRSGDVSTPVSATPRPSHPIFTPGKIRRFQRKRNSPDRFTFPSNQLKRR